MNEKKGITVHVLDVTSEWAELKSDAGSVLMRIITNANMHMEASCDGECACSTCHVYIDPDWLSMLEPPTEEEQMMLEYTGKPKGNSRLACQIKLRPELNGMRVKVVGK